MSPLETLEDLASRDSSTGEDERIMLAIGKRAFPNLVITCGVVYPEGTGRPLSIHQFAGMFVKALKGVSE